MNISAVVAGFPFKKQHLLKVANQPNKHIFMKSTLYMLCNCDINQKINIERNNSIQNAILVF